MDTKKLHKTTLTTYENKYIYKKQSKLRFIRCILIINACKETR